jgi:hypothetical protein
MKEGILLTASLAILVMCSSCHENFSPKGDYQQRLVVYAVLSNRSDSQYVRVYTTYNLTGFESSEHTTDTGVRGASVTLSYDSTSYKLAETMIPRDDKSRYSSDVLAYVAAPCAIQPGKKYSLSITSPQGNTSATATVPTEGKVYFSNPSILKNPDAYKEDIVASLGLSPVARGYVIRLYLDVDVYIGQNLVCKRMEVPSGIIQNQYQYPTLTRRPSDPAPQFNIYFSLDVYKVFRKDLLKQYGGFSLRGATLILTQVESNLYKYYSLVNGFQDPFSVREDLPDFTNIEGGLGVFGAMIEDSIVVDLR